MLLYSFKLEEGEVMLVRSDADRNTMAHMCNEYLGADIDHAEIDFVQYLNDNGIRAEWVNPDHELEWSTGNEYV